MSKESPVGHLELSFMTGSPQVDTFVTLVAHPTSRRSEVEIDVGLGDCACAVDQMLLETDTASDESLQSKMRNAITQSQEEDCHDVRDNLV